MRLDGAAENLRLFKADVLDRAALAAAVEGCEGVFHVASPVPADKIVDPESEVMVPAVKGTVNILEVCSSMKVQKVVVVSSTSSVHFNPNWPQGKPKDESCWSNKKVCAQHELWYCLAKTVAEETAWEYAEKNGLNVVTICPCIVFGPQLQPVVNTSSELLVYVLKGGPNAMNDRLWHIVDVRDVANALLLVYEKLESSGRYISAPNYITTKAILDLLKKTYPDYNYVNCKAEVDHNSPITPISSAKLRNLGWNQGNWRRHSWIASNTTGRREFCRMARERDMLAAFLISSGFFMPPRNESSMAVAVLLVPDMPHCACDVAEYLMTLYWNYRAINLLGR